MNRRDGIGESLIDRDSLNERRKIIEHLDGGIAQPLVVVEMTTDKDQLRTEFTRASSRHSAADSERPCFVRSGKHDPAADGDRLAAQGRVEQLFDRGIEGVQVRMEDGGCRFRPDGPPLDLENDRP